MFLHRPHLPVFSSGIAKIRTVLVDLSHLLLLHYPIVLLVFLSNTVVALLLVLRVDFW